MSMDISIILGEVIVVLVLLSFVLALGSYYLMRTLLDQETEKANGAASLRDF